MQILRRGAPLSRPRHPASWTRSLCAARARTRPRGHRFQRVLRNLRALAPRFTTRGVSSRKCFEGVLSDIKPPGSEGRPREPAQATVSSRPSTGFVRSENTCYLGFVTTTDSMIRTCRVFSVRRVEAAANECRSNLRLDKIRRCEVIAWTNAARRGDCVCGDRAVRRISVMTTEG